MKLDNYVCDNQMSLFEFLEQPSTNEKFCGDDRINRIVDSIEEIFYRIRSKIPPVRKTSKEYTVWDHVPYLGYRLSMIYTFDCEFINIPDRYCGVGSQKLYELLEFERLYNKAEIEGIELSISATPNMLFISSIDHKKRKVEKREEEE